MIIEEKITQGHAKILVGLDPHKAQTLVDTIIGQKLSVRETENLLKQKKSPIGSRPASPSTLFDAKLVQKLKQVLPLRYTLKSKKIEIVLPNEEALRKFITLLEKK
jgi:ParB family chromosome partitioning protein